MAASRDERRPVKEQGILGAYGAAPPRNGGMLILRVPDDDIIPSLDRVRDGDPYYQRVLAQYALIPWAPPLGKAALDTIYRCAKQPRGRAGAMLVHSPFFLTPYPPHPPSTTPTPHSPRPTRPPSPVD